MQTHQIILETGESLTAVEVLHAFLLLAKAEASFPCLTQQDVHLACLLMLPKALELAEQEEEDKE
jgi:hypothetical protein